MLFLFIYFTSSQAYISLQIAMLSLIVGWHYSTKKLDIVIIVVLFFFQIDISMEALR